MSTLEVVVNLADTELVEASTEIVLSESSTELLVTDGFQVEVSETNLELLLDAPVGIPDGGPKDAVLTKNSSTPFDVKWVRGVKITSSTTPPSDPQVGDIWIDIN